MAGALLSATCMPTSHCLTKLSPEVIIIIIIIIRNLIISTYHEFPLARPPDRHPAVQAEAAGVVNLGVAPGAAVDQVPAKYHNCQRHFYETRRSILNSV